ncbi:MAG: hypothetical protein P1V34_15965 [Alphaproteobacteria bacterium]|nr:hypothetical protein [Alphaproteobacteria bacterium]
MSFMLWKKVDNWIYTLHDLTTPSAEFERYESIVKIWHSKAEAGKIPNKRDFAFEDFRGWWGWLSLADIMDPDASSIKYRLWGTYVREMTGLEMTGKTMEANLGDRSDNTVFEATDIEFVQQIVKRRLIGVSTGPVDWKLPDYRQMSTIRLPLTYDGETVGSVLSASLAW